ncbi:DEAD-domain-containing protein [Pseudovirgaria hyperparasitica]|uniref:ATP-dependent RNA helicase n=1 Tax=Pseudovirgaria hyperparasitica TaxID=470096 RepID=A0A6A6WHH0_9PEZI|nr:DEAD-domain-containing protein [Pseudovirgaria hyperparasitica]KAF2761520.1 DEAD-domain-containing protein [Pseudovirgaria hyperparasitica]
MAPADVTGRVRPTKPKKQARALKRKRDDVSAEHLEQAVADLDVKNGTFKDFADLPLSEPTKSGLKAAHFSAMTDIQAKAIPLALKGADILGAAKTGSGKTLSFLVPVLENLYRAQLVGQDAGLGAMIISPTRELAIQIFEVLRKIGGKGHLFAAGLVIGGKSLKDEANALERMNILVCTPGRILQHLSQTATFSVDNLKMLVLDEADRILDIGFQSALDAIIEYLPPDRQTLLFSATQTKKVSELARLSLKEPEYIAVHEAASSATPKTLQQNYVLTPLPEKLDTLWSFIQSSKKSKILVFLSSGKQVRFVYETFRKMQPGISLLHLHGRQKQTARLDITSKFSSSQQSCLFATDVVARGLDFPAVDWVVQLDCPEDADTYIHRVGRTARYEREGRAVLFLDPSEEEGMLKRLAHKKVPIERINVRVKKQQSIKEQMQNLCFKDPQLKYLGQKAFISYVKSVHLQKDKDIFDVNALKLEEFAASMGLPGAPRIKFRKGDNSKELKNAPRQSLVISDEDDSDSEAAVDGEAPSKAKSKKDDAVRTRYDRMFGRTNQDVLAPHYAKLIHEEDDMASGSKGQTNVHGLEQPDSDDDFLNVKRRHGVDDDLSLYHNIENADAIDGNYNKKIINIPGTLEPLVIDSKRREKLLQSKKKVTKLKEKGTKLIFDDDGNAHPIYELEDEVAFKSKGAPEDQRRQFVEQEAEKVKQADISDKALAKEKKRVKKEKRKARERAEDEDGEDVQLENGGDAFADFVADAASSGGEGDESQEVERPKGRPKKWFEDDSDEDEAAQKKRKKNKRSARDAGDLETFEDLEAMAAGLLASG